MATFVVFDERLALPQLTSLIRLGVDDRLMAVPGLDRSDVAFPARQSPHFYFTSPVFLRVAGADLLLDPLAVRGLLEEEDSFVCGGEDLLFAVPVPIERPDVVCDVKLVINDLARPWFLERARGAAEDIE